MYFIIFFCKIIYLNNMPNNYHRPLHVAARSGCVQVVQNLVTRGADLFSVDNEGNKVVLQAMRY